MLQIEIRLQSLLFYPNNALKKLFLFSFITLSFIVRAQTWFHNTEHVSEVKIIFKQTNWDYILDSFYVAGDKERILASVWVDGIYYDSVGIRYKGFSSVSVDRDKNPFNIKLDYIRNQNHFGVDKIKLGNVIQDPSFVREVLSYSIARNYMPSSHANYCKVYINDDFWGIYTSVESVDNSFLAQYYGDSDGVFIKGNPSVVNQNGENSNLANSLGTDISNYYNYYELKSDTGWATFYKLIDKLNNDPSSLEEILNIDRTLWMHALNYTLINFDSYIGYSQNYYLYEDKNGQFNPILWDMNQSFGSFRLTDASEFFRGFTVEEAKTMDPLAHVNSFSVHPRPLIRNILNTPQRRRMYLAHIRSIVQDHFKNEAFKKDLDELQDLIKSYVKTDENKFYSYEDFLQNKTVTVQDLVEYPGITDLMDDRSDYLLSYTGISPIGSPSVNIPRYTKGKTNFIITTRVNSASRVYLFYRNKIGGLFTKVEMKDDGISGDEQAIDGIYGINIPVLTKNLDYYIYAENDSSGTFSPTNAAFNFYKIRELKQLVLNEFCASNKTLVADETNNYEDWIELYNNGDTAIDLSRYTLSNDINELAKWNFPNISIPGNTYLLLWADNDEEDGFLHTNFKLSSGGGAIYLSIDGEVVDEIKFGGQTTDLTTGRYPNGTGSFVLMEPTPNGFNGGRRLGVKFIEKPNVKIFPNPVNGKFYIESDISGSLIMNNIQGQTVLTRKINVGKNTIDASELASEVYFLNIINETTVVSKKIIKQ